MNHRRFLSVPAHLGAAVLTSFLLLGSAATATAAESAPVQPQFSAASADFHGRVRVRTAAAVPGGAVTLAGRGFKPGQVVSFSYGGVALCAPVTVGEKGEFKTRFELPDSADPGRYQLVASVANPAASLLVDLKISPNVPLSGQDDFNATFKHLSDGLYEVAFSPKAGALFVTSSAFSFTPGKGRSLDSSYVTRVDPANLSRGARVAPATLELSKAGKKSHAFPVFGVGVDDAHGTVWVTNTTKNTVAVYRQSDLKLVKQFEPGVAPHARDVVVDEKHGKAYVSALGGDKIVVFDTSKLAKIGDIAVETTRRGRDVKPFGPVGIALDEDGSRLFAASMSTNEVAVIDTASDTVEKVLPLEHAETAFDVAWDGKHDRILVVSQGTDNLLMLDAATGKVVHDVATGAGPLSVAFAPKSGLTYVANRGSGTVTVVDAEGKIVANLAAGTFPNHLAADGEGGVFVVNKARRGGDDPTGNRVGHISPR